MFITTPSAKIGKVDLEYFIENLPPNEKEIQVSQSLDLSLEAYDLYSKGVPYSRRSVCLYYFYHFYPVHNEAIEENALERWEQLNCLADQLQKDKQAVKYLGLLDPVKYFEVFQKRGIIEAWCSGLENYLNLFPDIEWGIIQDRVLAFIESEPICSQYLLAKMLSGLNKYYSDNNLKTSVRYRIAQRIWECSTDYNHLQTAWLCLNDPEDVLEYKKTTLAEAEVEKLLKLEKLEKEAMRTFDEVNSGSNPSIAGDRPAPGRYAKRRLNQLFTDEVCMSWIRLIDGSIDLFDNDDNYVKGYAEYLKGYVCYSTGHLERAYKELNKAYFHQYNPILVLMYIIYILEDLNKRNEAVKYAQETIGMLNANPEDLENEEWLKKVAGLLGCTNNDLVELNTVVKRKREENEKKKNEIIRTSISEKIGANRRQDIAERVKKGINLFDNLIDPVLINNLADNLGQLNEIHIKIPVYEAEALGLDEIELFNYNIENNSCNITPEITLSELIKYNINLIKERYAENKTLEDEGSGTFDITAEFPNSLACMFIAQTAFPDLIVKKLPAGQAIQNNFSQQKLSIVNDQLAIEDLQYRRYLMIFGLFIIIISIILIISLLI